jgi:hypothetical protein
VTNPVVAFIYFLLLLLAVSMALGAFRWLGGGSFLPEPGRGTVEEDRHPSSALGGFVKGYVLPLVCGAVALPIMLPTNAGPSTIMGRFRRRMPSLRFGRNRGWY